MTKKPPHGYMQLDLMRVAKSDLLLVQRQAAEMWVRYFDSERQLLRNLFTAS